MVRVLKPVKITMSNNLCVKEYAKNALYPYPVKEKILSSRYHSNTTNFVYKQARLWRRFINKNKKNKNKPRYI